VFYFGNCDIYAPVARGMATPLRTIASTTFRWGCVWAVIGLLVGVAMMLGRVPPIAEPGAPSGFGFYSFWIPVCLGAASVFGVLLGLIYACLMAAIDLWWPRGETKPGAMAKYGQRLLCGAIAGGLIGWPLMNDWNGMWVVGIGMASALVAGYINRPKPRALELEPGGTESK
jgi:uncharacterized membrane protein